MRRQVGVLSLCLSVSLSLSLTVSLCLSLPLLFLSLSHSLLLSLSPALSLPLFSFSLSLSLSLSLFFLYLPLFLWRRWPRKCDFLSWHKHMATFHKRNSRKISSQAHSVLIGQHPKPQTNSVEVKQTCPEKSEFCCREPFMYLRQSRSYFPWVSPEHASVNGAIIGVCEWTKQSEVKAAERGDRPHTTSGEFHDTSLTRTSHTRTCTVDSMTTHITWFTSTSWHWTFEVSEILGASQGKAAT